MSRYQVWVDLPDEMLHSIIAHSGSFSVLAFAATCRSWRAAFSSYPSKSTFSTLFPPVLLQPDVPVGSPRHQPFGDKLPCHAIDLASKRLCLCCQIPIANLPPVNNDSQSPLGSLRFVGASYGHLIFSSNTACLIVDVFTGVSVSVSLTAPPTSPNSHLLITSRSHSFFWRVGSRSWLRASPCDGKVKQIVAFKGQFLGINSESMLFVVHLTPQIRVERMAVSWVEISSTRCHLANLYLVACGDMLLLVGCRGSYPARGDTFEAFRLDQSTEHAKWVKVEDLGNWAIFISTDERIQPLSFMNPERWGGKSNCIYCYSHDSEDWIAFELGKPASHPDIFVFIGRCNIVQPMWVVPNIFSLCGPDG
ncbi:uncharacterized protein LOC104581658 isoform X2 [Brachypodium distachyon]|nr:uncharacterized protein LOC104581658 isoform X2 [Brachypodium distachyon]XP_014753716.1 uncharacterized protein LOC104581658 isoform X2 [Brachypodium distachyon]|eukprot:XP_014753714.1 uncharacterized protein LOC104581658 isoform X2 [Brachypodium distachyon]